jgi:hypothetical protein
MVFIFNIGSDVKCNSIEFRYSEPKKLQEIEKFFIEFYISVRNNSDIYYNLHHELTYFDYSIIYTINDILVNNKNMINNPNIVDVVINKINNRLFENYLNISKNGNNKINVNDRVPKDKEVDLKAKNEKESNRGQVNINFLYIEKETILKEIFYQSNNNEEYDMLEGGIYKKDEDGWMVRNIQIEDKHNSRNTSMNNTLVLSRSDANVSKLMGNHILIRLFIEFV